MSSSRIRLNHDAYRVGWISALPLEKTAAIAILDADHGSLPQPKSDNNTYHLGEIGGHNIVIACLPSGRYGLTSAAVVSQQMLSTFPSIEIGLMVGIGGGVPSTAADIRLGDIVVSKPTGLFPGVVQYDYGKTMGDGSFHRTGSLNNPPDRLLTAISDLEANHRLGNNNIALHLDNAAKMHPSMKASFIYPGVNEDILFKASYVHEDDKPSCNSCDPGQVVPRSPRESTTPFIHYGLIASANQVMKNARTRDKLGEELGILCFEMEAAGLMNHFPCLVIRGICDYSDSHKNKQWQDYAAATAAAYARELLESSLPTTLLPSASDAVRIRSKIPISKAVFFGRKEELHQIQQLFDVGMHQRQAAVIWGPSGYGKTQLALEYLSSRDMDYEVVLWIDSSSRTMVEESFEQISLHLGSSTKSMKSGVDSVVEWLERQSQSWIIVFDGIESMEDDDGVDDFDIRDYLPACKHGHMLLVTTSSDLHLRLAYPGIEIQGVDDQAGASILLKCAGIASEQTSNNTAAIAISRKLGGIPLAIEQAGSYLSYGMSSMTDYKKHFETRFRDSTLKTPMRKYVGSYEKGRTLWTTFDMLYHALQQKSKGSACLLQLVAFLGRGRIPFEIISGDQGGPVQPASEQSEPDHLADQQLSLIAPWLMELRSQTIKLAMAVRQLEVSGFVKFHRREGDTLIESLTLHDLARSFLQSKISQEDRLDMVASSFLLNGRQLYDGEQVPEEDIIRRHMGRLSVVLDQFQVLIPNSMLEPPDGRFFQLCGAVAPLFARVFRYREQLEQAAQFWAIAIQHRALSVEGVPHLEGLMEAAEIDSRIGDLESAIRKYSTIVPFGASSNVAGENIYIRAVGRLRECRESLRRREQDSVRAVVATSAPKRMRQTATDARGAGGRNRNRQTWDEYIQYEEDDEWLHRSDFEEIIHLDGTDAAMALAYMASTLRNYYNYYHAQPRRPKDDGKYWGIFRQALGDNSVAGKSALRAPYASRKTAPPAITIVQDLNFARSWATTFGSTALNDWLASEEGPANFNALAQGQTGMIDMLVQANETHTALCWAVLQPPTICNEILHGLMSIEDFNPGSLLLEVMRRPGSRTAIQVTLDLGVSVNYPDYIKNAALLCAASANNGTAVDDLLSGGSNVCHSNATGDTALHLAARAGNYPLVRSLLDQGAVVSQTNDAGRTALHEAVAAKAYRTAIMLVWYGSSAKVADNDGQTALHIAVQGNVEPDLGLLNTLFDYGASITQQDNNGRTALHYAAAKHPQRVDMVRLLIQRHCKQQGRLQQFLGPSTKKVINMRDRDGRTAVHEAQRAGNTDISSILEGNSFT